MPLRTDIDHLALAEASDYEGEYAYLIDPSSHRLVCAARYLVMPDYLECADLVSEGYGPTMFLRLAQRARRMGLAGVAPDRFQNSEDAKRMDERFFRDPIPGMTFARNPDAFHAEDYLNQAYALDRDVVDEARARRNAEDYFAAARHPGDVPRLDRAAAYRALKVYLLRAEFPAAGDTGVA